MFKVNNKVTPCSSVSIVKFKQVNAGWPNYKFGFTVF